MTEISLGPRLYVGPDPLERQLGRALLGAVQRSADEGMDMPHAHGETSADTDAQCATIW